MVELVTFTTDKAHPLITNPLTHLSCVQCISILISRICEVGKDYPDSLLDLLRRNDVLTF